VRVVLTQAAEPYAARLRSSGVTHVTAHGMSLTVEMKNSSLTTPDLVRTLVEAGACVESVMPEEPPLEDVYLKLLHPEGGIQ
jgi:hypothetical protein